MKFIIQTCDDRTFIGYGLRPGTIVNFQTARIKGRIERQTRSNFRRAFSESLTEMNIKPKGNSFRLDDIVWKDGFIEFHYPTSDNSRWLYDPNMEHASAYPYWLAYAGTAVPYPFTIYSNAIESTRAIRTGIVEELMEIAHQPHDEYGLCVVKNVFIIENISMIKDETLKGMADVSRYVDRYTFGDAFIALERPVMSFGIDRTRVFWSRVPFGLSIQADFDCTAVKGAVVIIKQA